MLTNASLLLFAKKPQSFFITSEVKCAQFYGNEITKPIPAYQVYQGNIFELIEQAVSFVMSRINVRVGTREKRTDVAVKYELPLDAVREAIVNAITHRDYTSNGSVQVMLFRNRLEVWNPGALPFGLTLAKLLLPHPSIPTNPLLANPVYLAGYIERMGTGTRDIVSKCLELGLRQPEFHQNEEFRVTLWRKEETSGSVTIESGLSWDQVGTKLGLSWDQVKKVLNICLTDRSMVEIMEVVGVTNRTKFRIKYIAPLVEEGLLAMSIPDKANSPQQKYSTTQKGKLLCKGDSE